MRMKHLLFALCSLLYANHGEAQLLANHGSMGSSYVNPISPRSYSTATYTPGKTSWIYVPPAYGNNVQNYPLIVFWPGYGSTDGDPPKASFSNVNNSGEGLGQYLTAGDNPPDVLIIIPQNLIYNVDYGHAEWDAAKAYMQANYRVDVNRMYVTGLSGGAIGCLNVLTTETDCAAMIPVSGPAFTNLWTSLSGVGFWQHHGTADTQFGRTIGGTLYNAGGTTGSSIDLTPAPRTTYYFGVGHASGVWDTQVYNRKERTDATGTAAFDFVRFLKKFSKDQSQQATFFVDNAEHTSDIVDYREALALVNNLSAGGTKTALQARLTSLKTIVDRSGTRYVVSCNATGTTVSQTGINDWNATFAAGQGLSNIVDDTGGASTLTFVITNQLASSGRDNNAGQFNAGRQKFKGLKLEYNLTGLVLSHSITNGRITISNIPSGQKIDVLLHAYHISGDDDNNVMSAQSAISATMNSVTKTQYSAYNNAYYLSFTDVPESSGTATLDMKTVSTRDVILQGFEILVHP